MRTFINLMIDHDSKVKILQTKVDGEIASKKEIIWTEDGLCKIIKDFESGMSTKEAAKKYELSYQHFTQRLRWCRRTIRNRFIRDAYKYFMLGGTPRELKEYFDYDFGDLAYKDIVVKNLIETMLYKK